ncbi:MAG TPA: hypothetical protein VFU06_03845 [Longimicrobiales bacterium]|nr:hypothetical protein [Longimicrobiales bacterium]
MSSSESIHLTPPARLACFGADSTPATVELLERPFSWRMTRALLAAGIGLGLAPVAAIVPPHIPWAGAALIGGGVIARGRWIERYTLARIEGTCPRCSGAIKMTPARRLKDPESITCGNCGETVLVEVEIPGS